VKVLYVRATKKILYTDENSTAIGKMKQ